MSLLSVLTQFFFFHVVVQNTSFAGFVIFSYCLCIVSPSKAKKSVTLEGKCVAARDEFGFGPNYGFRAEHERFPHWLIFISSPVAFLLFSALDSNSSFEKEDQTICANKPLATRFNQNS